MNTSFSGKMLEKWDKEYIWHPFTQMKDWIDEEILIIEKADGVFLYTTDGKKYFDGVSSLWVNVHGHRHISLNNALMDQMDKIAHTTLLGLANIPSILLAKKLVEITPEGLEKVFFSDNGSTAVEIAIKMAYQATQQLGKTKKKYFISFENAYHGDTIGSVSIGGIDLFHKLYRPLLFDVIRCPAPYCYRCPLDLEPQYCGMECIQKISQILKNKSDSVVGVIIEPMIQGAAGMITQPQGFLSELKQLCEQHDVFLITDEVATGFGRTGKMFACEHEGINPDFMALAKGLTGGYLPVAVTMTAKNVFEAFLGDYAEKKTFFHGHTYTGNPLGCSVALKNLELFEEEETLSKLQQKIAFMEEALQGFYELEHVGDIRQCGLMVGIELVKNKKTKKPYHWNDKIGIKVTHEARKHGVIIRPLGNVIVIMPPLVIDLQLLNELLQIIYESVKIITENK